MNSYTIGILGGGLAGLTAAIHLATKGQSVCLIEKQGYPHHKVCGEYVSKEVLPYFKSLNISLEGLDIKHINKLHWSTVSGKVANVKLPLGGIGVSRFGLDNLLYNKALEVGVIIIQDTVSSVVFKNDRFFVNLQTGSVLTFNHSIGAFGKRSSIDKLLNRRFIQNRTKWMAVKAHYRNDTFNDTTVQLHNFNGGYCGLSKVETNAVNMCYLTTYDSFKKYGAIESYNLNVLSKNRYLNSFFKNSELDFDNHLSIAQISFENKSTVEDHVLMVGDSAGLIHPLCGNGMAMAIHSAKLVSETLLKAINSSWSRTQIEAHYTTLWQDTFSKRLKTGRYLQHTLLNKTLSKLAINTVAQSPYLLKQIIKLTHGKPIV